MLKRIASMLSGAAPAGATPTGSEDRITIATCVLLLEMAHADDYFSSSESGRIRDILVTRLGLQDDQVGEILSIAGRDRDASADLWTYTNLVNESFTYTEKLRLVEMIWEVAYADGSLDQNEDYLVHKLANLLHVHHGDLIAAKIRAKGAGPGAT